MIGNYKLLIIILGIITLIMLIFGIFGFIAYTKLSNEKFQSADKSYCIPCVNSTGNSYNNVDGTTIPCKTIPEYIESQTGQETLINALKKIPNDVTFDFNITGNAATATNSDGKGNIVYQNNDVGWCGGGTTTWISGKGGHLEWKQSTTQRPRWSDSVQELVWCFPGAFHKTIYSDSTPNPTSNKNT